jgi:hypothetical protein
MRDLTRSSSAAARSRARTCTAGASGGSASRRDLAQVLRALDQLALGHLALAQPAQHDRGVVQLLRARQLVHGFVAVPPIGELDALQSQSTRRGGLCARSLLVLTAWALNRNGTHRAASPRP